MNDKEEAELQAKRDAEWLAKFPCVCGHGPDRHTMGPIDSVCQGCVDCHGEGGAFLMFGRAVVRVVHEDDQAKEENTGE